ncbi:MAG TPA: hypothetical protein ENJ09_16395 [Planctomycetes bacterium]|nr:hypothetical protein [Planctomycetota bacterium]
MRTFLFSVGALLVVTLSILFEPRLHDVEAGTAVRMDIAELTEHADLILEGRVLLANAFEVDGRIETEYLIQVDRTFEGEDQPYRTVRMPGGVLPDGRGLILAGMPRIVPGEEELLFLSAEGPTGVRVPVGLAQGKLSLVRNADGSKSLLSDMAGVVLVSEDGSVSEGAGAMRVDYAEVVARIEATLAEKAAREERE